MLGTGVAFAVGWISSPWTSPNVTVSEPVNVDLIITSPDFTSNVGIYIGDTIEKSVRLYNPSPLHAAGYPHVRVEFQIHGSGISDGDVTLEYYADEGFGAIWHTLPTTDMGDALVGYFGPSVGFPVGYGYNVVTPIKATFNTVGTYYATAQAFIP